MELTIATSDVPGGAVVRVAGEVDIHTAPGLSDALSRLVEDGAYHLVLDLTGVQFLDSTGLGVLVAGLKKVRAHDGSLELVCPGQRLLKLFRITGLINVFVIHDTVEAALADRGPTAGEVAPPHS